MYTYIYIYMYKDQLYIRTVVNFDIFGYISAAKIWPNSLYLFGQPNILLTLVQPRFFFEKNRQPRIFFFEKTRQPRFLFRKNSITQIFFRKNFRTQNFLRLKSREKMYTNTTTVLGCAHIRRSLNILSLNVRICP